MGGTTKRAAREALDTSWRLPGQKETDAAVRAGRLSGAQAAVADGAQADPDAQEELLEAAERESVTGLRDAVRRTKAAADPDARATARRLHRGRSLRRWTDAEGAYNMSVRTCAEQGARVDAALQPAIEAVFAAARKAGLREPVEAYAVDALESLVTGTPATPAPHQPGRRRARARPRRPAGQRRGRRPHQRPAGRQQSHPALRRTGTAARVPPGAPGHRRMRGRRHPRHRHRVDAR